MRTIDWVDGAVEIIDQTALPDTERTLRLSTVDEVIDAIQRLAVRGAPAIGVAGAFGVAIAAREFAGEPDALSSAVLRLETARPTAVNLARGVRLAAAALATGPEAVLEAALALRDAEVTSSAAMASLGADLVTELCGSSPRLLTHCNTGGLATVTGGTALGVVAELHRRGGLGGVIASETRPLLQGARLTAWELGRLGIDYRVAVDGAGPFLMARGEVDAVILGADRVCANGDVINKVGSYAHALGARAAGIPFIVVAPESTVDEHTPSGDSVEIEDRAADEVLHFGTTRSTPPGARAINPAFDVTPAALVTAIVTDTRVLRPAP
ncbi:S-methyl-5-thioribose-1-phosphate isomerase [Luedemannella flava]|uniref:Methylthioribose-1-phosphate isomerase n=1 Tax=Luedemannella flava TaxID=349316 RepID=A0ABN2LRX0_9ACTN